MLVDIQGISHVLVIMQVHGMLFNEEETRGQR